MNADGSSQTNLTNNEADDVSFSFSPNGHWQIGEVSVATGAYESAEGHYRNALGAFPDFPHAVTSLARLRAVQGDLRSGHRNV